MAINFEFPERVQQEKMMAQALAEGIMRPVARELDEDEHARPVDFIKMLWPVMRDAQARQLDRLQRPKEEKPDKPKRPSIFFLRQMVQIETLSWGDAAQYLCIPSPLLAESAIKAVGTPEQQERFLRRFAEGEPKWGAMAMTEPNAGSDTKAIETTAVLDSETNEWILNGEKVFITSATLAMVESDGITIVWATVDPTAGRAGMKPFVVEANTPGVTVSKSELKHGIRASDTASIKFSDCRIPYDNLLGDPDVRQRDAGTKGFKGAMATFDASRPMVAASAVGVGRAALEFVKATLAEEGVTIPYGQPPHKLTAIQRDVLEMEAQYKAAYLLTLRATAMLDAGQHNSLEASMAKAKAGRAMTRITQQAVELLGMKGYSREWLVEKWMRDARINDIYEGTGQINLLIVARRILGYSSRELQ